MTKLGVLLLLATVLVGCDTQSASRPSAAVKAQYEASFQEMLKDPGNPQTVMSYAAAATKAGDYEGAIGAYEGLLLVDSDLPRVKVELGILYFRLKSYDVSRTNLEAALASPSLPAELRAPTEKLLAKMPKQSKSSRT